MKAQPKMRVVEAGLVTLEPQRATHAEAMFAVLSDPAIYAHENEPPQSVDRLRERFSRLESRRSADGREHWLNWVVRLLPTAELIGYVQATVYGDGRAAIAYEFSSRFWGRGLAFLAVRSMLSELVVHYQVRDVCAVLKKTNGRSLRLLERLGFAPASPELRAKVDVEQDELLMQRRARTTHAAALTHCSSSAVGQ